MKIILVDQRHGRSRTIVLKGWLKSILSLCLLGAPVALGFLGYQLAISHNPANFDEQAAINWETRLLEQGEQLDLIREQSRQELEALTRRLATMQAQLLRLDAVGERVVEVAELDEEEFDFSQPVAVGGPESNYSVDYTVPQFMDAIEQLESQLEDRQQQLEILEEVLIGRQVQAEAKVDGRPVEKGWISSRFGRRADPFTGQLAYHPGIDFSSEQGSDIQAVAGGVVTWSAQKSGYGLTVEINHGNGYETRYAHAEQLLVEVGDIVKKGETIGLVGSTGRSTGPHLHFEVFKNGRVVDPASYINRTVR
ncbi:MAG: M23 family metallopeptidase [Gammaproteobacteria bacterium]|nr:M23 family metallopeptidase [Pseudomonadales bacterium]MCP5345571.1 M23 family metallopeptidase [Pseudomonadales bacterium]